MSWWTAILLTVAPAWFVELAIHEASHLLVGWVHEGRRPVGYWPWPHVHAGRFYFARCELQPSSVPTPRHAPRCIAPMYAGSIVAASTALILCVLSVTGVLRFCEAWPWFAPSILFGFGDAAWFWRGYLWSANPRNDGYLWRYGEG